MAIVSKSPPNLQRKLIFTILFLFALLAAVMNFMSFFLDWEDTIHLGVRTRTGFWLLGDQDCEDHPWSRDVFLECSRSSGLGAIGSSVRPKDCIRVCDDDPCASSRRTTAWVSVSFTLISIVVLVLFLVALSACFVYTIPVWTAAIGFAVSFITTFAAWFPFWLSRHGWVASCPTTDFCPAGAARCNTHGFWFMFIATLLVAVGGLLALFFEYIFLRRIATARAADGGAGVDRAEYEGLKSNILSPAPKRAPKEM